MTSGMHLRFRHRFPLAGHFLHWTLSRHGVSLNMHVGLFSRSWGTQGNTTTVDAPGHLGFFWRKQTRKRRRRLSEEEISAHAAGRWTHLAVALVLLEAVVEAVHIWLHPFSDVVVSGSPLLVLLLLSGGLCALIVFAHRRGIMGGLVIFVLALVGLYVQWKLFGALAWNDVHAATPAVVHAHAHTSATA
jgi:hypothetical protein